MKPWLMVRLPCTVAHGGRRLFSLKGYRRLSPRRDHLIPRDRGVNLLGERNLDKRLMGDVTLPGEGGRANWFQGHFTSGGMEERMESILPPVLRPNNVPRSYKRLNST